MYYITLDILSFSKLKKTFPLESISSTYLGTLSPKPSSCINNQHASFELFIYSIIFGT